jgi:DNA-binding transcriptional regulator/RsmH inhibitor MraZ
MSPITKIVVRVDEQRRFEVEPSLLQSTLGLKIASGESVDLWALTGGCGQLQLLGQQNELVKMRQQYAALVTKDPPSWDSSGDENTDVLRKLIALIPVTVCAEKNRRKLRITLPTEAVNLDLVKTKDWIVVLAFGEILELWPKATWRTASTIGDVREFTNEVKEVLDL